MRYILQVLCDWVCQPSRTTQRRERSGGVESPPMFLKANGPCAENMTKPRKYEAMLKPIPLARTVVGQISEHNTKLGASMNWNSTMKRKMQATAAPFPVLWLVPKYGRWSMASTSRSAARIGNPITETLRHSWLASFPMVEAGNLMRQLTH